MGPSHAAYFSQEEQFVKNRKKMIMANATMLMQKKGKRGMANGVKS